MKLKLLTTVIALTFIFASNSIFADSIVNAYTCKLKDGKKKEEVQAVNVKWLAWVRKNVNENIMSALGTAVVGNQDVFMFMDTYPDLGVWAATQTALENQAGTEIEDMFDAVSDCSKNSLWKFEPSE
jgi:hypothetical protein